MPTQLQIRRGSTTDHNSFTGAAGELTVDTTKDTLRVHDGSTAGGFELARADGSNLNNITSNITVNGTVTADGLTVGGTSAGGEVEGLRLTNSSTTTNSSSSIIFNLSTASADSAKIEAIRTNSPTSSDTELAFSQIRNGTLEERMRIDSAGNVGIGTDSPAKLLDVSSNSSPTIRISNTRNDSNWDTDPVFGALEFYSADGSGSGASVRASVKAEAASAFGNATDFVFRNGDSLGVQRETMRLDYRGYLAIGTDNPFTTFHVDSGVLNEVARFESSDHTAYISLQDSATSNSLHGIGATGDVLQLFSNGSEAARIDSSSNLLVGTTNASNTVAGFRAYTGGNIGIARASQCVELNRLSTDGSLIGFQKDGTTVGSIGTQSSNFYLGSGDVTLYFSDSGDTIIPRGTNGNARPNAIDLGNAGNAWRDLYVSGGAYLGGTTAANKLDDYEEGTFTLTTQSDPTGTLTAGGGNYVKIGQQVFIEGAFQVGVNFTNNSVGGLPFAVATATGVGSSVRPIFLFDTTGTGKYLQVGNGGSTLQLYDSSGAVDAPDTTGNTYRFMGSYRTSA